MVKVVSTKLAFAQVLLLALAISVSPLIGQTVEEECDRLAASPTDENRVGPGVAFEQLDAVTAIPVCEQAVQANPSLARLKFQLARALQKAGRQADAAAGYESLSR